MASPSQLKLYYRVVQGVKKQIGSKWPMLASKLMFSQTDIDAIKVQHPHCLHSQITLLFLKWGMQFDSGQGTVYKLICALRLAARESRDQDYNKLAQSAFRECLKGVFDEKVNESWHLLAKAFNFSPEEKRDCTLKDPNSKPTQAYEFTCKLCEKFHWDLLLKLPMVLKEVGFEEKANEISKDIFGTPLTDLQSQLYPEWQPSLNDLVIVTVDDSTMYGTVKWIGTPSGCPWPMAGLEMEEKYDCVSVQFSDGRYEGQNYFRCNEFYGAYFPVSDIQPDPRFPAETDSVKSLAASLMNVHLDDPFPDLRLPFSSLRLSVSSENQSAEDSLVRDSPYRRQSAGNQATVQGLQSSPLTERCPIPETSPSSFSTVGYVLGTSEQVNVSQRSQSSPKDSHNQQPLGSQVPRQVNPLDSVFKPTSPAHNQPIGGSHIPPRRQVSSSGSGHQEEFQDIQPLLDLGEKKVYCLRFAGDLTGLLIGRQGNNVQRIQDESNATIHILKNKASSLSEDCKVIVIGTKDQCMNAIGLMVDLVNEKRERLHAYTEILILTDAEAARVVGQNGLTIRTIQRVSGARVDVDPRPEGVVGLINIRRECRIKGSTKQIEEAKKLIRDVQQGKDITPLVFLYMLSRHLEGLEGVNVLSSVDPEELAELSGLLP